MQPSFWEISAQLKFGYFITKQGKCGFWGQLAVTTSEEKQYFSVGYDDFEVPTDLSGDLEQVV